MTEPDGFATAVVHRVKLVSLMAGKDSEGRKLADVGHPVEPPAEDDYVWTLESVQPAGDMMVYALAHWMGIRREKAPPTPVVRLQAVPAENYSDGRVKPHTGDKLPCGCFRSHPCTDSIRAGLVPESFPPCVCGKAFVRDGDDCYQCGRTQSPLARSRGINSGSMCVCGHSRTAHQEPPNTCCREDRCQCGSFRS